MTVLSLRYLCQENHISTHTSAIASALGLKRSKSSRKTNITLRKKTKRRLVRVGLVTVNILLVAGATAFVLRTPAGEPTSASAVFTSPSEQVSPLDQLSSADIAVHVAQLADLYEKQSVMNNADTVNAQLSLAHADDKVIAKPQLITTDVKSYQDIVEHEVKEGETLASISESYGVTSDSIRWSNSMTSSTVSTGDTLTIPPIDGIVHTVKDGDTPESLAQKFSSDAERIISFNDAEIDGLVEGRQIVIPDAVQPVVRTTNTFAWAGYTPTYGGNAYAYGWCTWHTANRRAAIGRPLPNNLGNAITWYTLAQRGGMSVGGQPQAGAVIWHANLGGLGHVAFVEKLNEDGSILVSDMNYPTWGAVTHRTVSPSDFHLYRFIY